MGAEPSVWRVRALGKQGDELGEAAFAFGSENDAPDLVERFRAFVLGAGGDLRASGVAAIAEQRHTVDAILREWGNAQRVQSPSERSDLRQQLYQAVILIKFLEQLMPAPRA